MKGKEEALNKLESRLITTLCRIYQELAVVLANLIKYAPIERHSSTYRGVISQFLDRLLETVHLGTKVTLHPKIYFKASGDQVGYHLFVGNMRYFRVLAEASKSDNSGAQPIAVRDIIGAADSRSAGTR